jgi:hypothetical protein
MPGGRVRTLWPVVERGRGFDTGETFASIAMNLMNLL